MSTLSHSAYQRRFLPRPHSGKEASDESREESSQGLEGSGIGRSATRCPSIAGAEDGSADENLYQNRFSWLPGSSTSLQTGSIHPY